MNGTFEFESEHNAGSKKNATDARIRMLEEFGNEAVSWVIDSIELVSKSDEASDIFQPQLDFREPKKTRRRRTVERGKI